MKVEEIQLTNLARSLVSNDVDRGSDCEVRRAGKT